MGSKLGRLRGSFGILMEKSTETFELFRMNTMAQSRKMEPDGGSGIGKKQENKRNQNGKVSKTFPYQEMVEPILIAPGSLHNDKSK